MVFALTFKVGNSSIASAKFCAIQHQFLHEHIHVLAGVVERVFADTAAMSHSLSRSSKERARTSVSRRSSSSFARAALSSCCAVCHARRSACSADVADRLARSAGNRWPEAGTFPEETSHEALSRVAKQWVAMTSLAAALFILAPRLMSRNGRDEPPIAVAVLFPAIVFGIAAMVQYFRRKRP
jgi:hypothetical protein